MKIKYLANQNQELETDQLLQVTALAYLQDALAQERYEECAYLIREARKYGVQGRNIQKALAEAAQRARYGRPDRPARQANGVRRF